MLFRSTISIFNNIVPNRRTGLVAVPYLNIEVLSTLENHKPVRLGEETDAFFDKKPARDVDFPPFDNSRAVETLGSPPISS